MELSLACASLPSSQAHLVRGRSILGHSLPTPPMRCSLLLHVQVHPVNPSIYVPLKNNCKPLLHQSGKSSRGSEIRRRRRLARGVSSALPPTHPYLDTAPSSLTASHLGQRARTGPLARRKLTLPRNLVPERTAGGLVLRICSIPLNTTTDFAMTILSLTTTAESLSVVAASCAVTSASFSAIIAVSACLASPCLRSRHPYLRCSW